MPPRTEVLVPFRFTWWTYLALRADASPRFAEIRFVESLSSAAENIVIDASLLDRLPKDQRSSTTLFIVLWNGQESYLEYQALIHAITTRVARVELLLVGDLLPESMYCTGLCARLFAQNQQNYRRSAQRPGQAHAIGFSTPWAKYLTRYRGLIITAKVALQLSLTRSWARYAKRRYVFCGQSGYSTLLKYKSAYRMLEPSPIWSADGLDCSDDFLLSWLKALITAKKDWSWPIIARAVLRVTALRTLHRFRPDQLFLNLVPEKNLNAYQAAFLFKQHIFLEFGGIHGEEEIYPRTADLTYFNRKVLRFDNSVVLHSLARMNTVDRPQLQNFLRGYENHTIERLDACSTDVSTNADHVLAALISEAEEDG